MISRRHMLAQLPGIMAIPALQGATPQATPVPEGTPAASPAATPVALATLATVQQLFDGLRPQVESGEMPGLVVYAETAEGTFHEAAGVADLQTGAPLDANSPFQVGSNTKMLTAVIVLQLHEEGLLKVDDPLAKHLPDVAAGFDSGSDITIRMLLQHTSGIYDYVEDVAAHIFIDHLKNASDAAMTQAWTAQEIVNYTTTYRRSNSYFPPGVSGQWHYTNTGYVILGLVIEQVTGRSYADVLQQRVLDRLGMQNSSLIAGDWTSDVHGYLQPPFSFDTTAWNLSQAWSAGALAATPQDMATFLRALLAGELFADAATLPLMQTIATPPESLAQYGMGLMRFGEQTWGHGGQTLGFQSHVLYNLATDLLAVVWTNTATPSSSFSFVPYSI